MPRTTKELKQVLRQYLAAKSGTKPFKGNIKTGFLGGGSVKKSDLSEGQLAIRARIKSQIRKAKQDLPNRPNTDRQAARSRLSQNQGNPTTPTTPPTRIPPITNKPSIPPNTTPPTKPIPRRGTVGASTGPRMAALQKMSKR